MTSRLTGALFTFATRALYVGPLIESAPHRHHAAQILWAPGGIELEQQSLPSRRATLHVVPPQHAHRHGGTSLAAVLWVDPDELRSRTLRNEAPSRQLAKQLKEFTADAAQAVADQLFALAVSSDQPVRVARHPAVIRMRKWLDTNAPEDSAHLGTLARQSGLSVRQLRHRFTQEVGINPRAYRRWCRLRRAIEAIERGASLTEGALDGGFADSAHFSRVFREQFGISPSLALSGLRDS